VLGGLSPTSEKIQLFLDIRRQCFVKKAPTHPINRGIQWRFNNDMEKRLKSYRDQTQKDRESEHIVVEEPLLHIAPDGQQ